MSPTGEAHLEHSGGSFEFVEVDSFEFLILSYQDIRFACIKIQTETNVNHPSLLAYYVC
jgi:hypothetical protein